MIEINLIVKKRKKMSISFAGADLTKIRPVPIILVILINYGLSFALEEYQSGEKKLVDIKEKELQGELKKIRSLNRKKENRELDTKIRKLNERKKLVETRMGQVDELMKLRTNPQKILEELARIMPKDLWFDELSIENGGKVKIIGGAEEFSSIDQFITSARRMGYFGDSINLANTETVREKERSKEYRVENFEVEGTIKYYDAWEMGQ